MRPPDTLTDDLAHWLVCDSSTARDLLMSLYSQERAIHMLADSITEAGFDLPTGEGFGPLGIGSPRPIGWCDGA